MLTRFDKTFFLSKLSTTESDKKESIMKELNEQFNNACKYLDTNKNVVIGKKLPTIHEIILERTNNRKVTRKTTQTKLHNGDNNTNNVELIDHNELKKIFNRYKKSKTNSLEEIQLMNIPKEVESELLIQERHLASMKREEKYKNKLSKFLSEKTNKKENELLMNSIDHYCHKKDYIDSITRDQNINETIKGKFRWNISLRRPNHFEGNRKTYINLRTKDDPLWTVVKETYPSKNIIKVMTEPDEISHRSNYCSIDYTKMKRSLIINDNKSRNIKNKFQQLKSINLTGKNLLQLEYENVMKLKTLKYIKRKPLDNVKNNENELICKNYQFSPQKTSASLSSLLMTNQSSFSQSKHLRTFMEINNPYNDFKL